MNPKTPSLLLVLCLAAPPLWSQAALQGPDLANNRARMPHSTGPAVACVLADLDGDGDQDLVRAAAATVVIALQDSSGRFIPSAQAVPMTPVSPAAVQALAVGLLDLDKSPDVLVAHRDGTCRVAVNNGQGKVSRTYLLPPLVNVVRPVLHAVLVADLDGVHGDDIVVVLSQLPPQVYLANKSGGYDAPTPLRGPALLNPAATLVDIDQDGDLDLVLVTGDAKTPAQPFVHLNSNGQLGLPAMGFFPTALSLAASQVLAADTNRDGRAEIIFATANSAAAVPVIYTRPSSASLLYQAQVNSGKFTISSALSLFAGDANGDGFADLVVLQSDGSLVLGINGGTLSPGMFAAPTALLGTGGRQCLWVGDLEPDKDVDMVVGGTDLEDSVLLGDGKGNFLDTEARGMGIAPHPLSAGALVDATGDGDPDIVLYDRGGKPALLVNDNGQARFKMDPLQVVLPALPTLPSATYTDVQPAAVASTSEVDLLVLGTPVQLGQAGLRVLVRTRSGTRYLYRDETSTRWPGQNTYAAMAAGDIGGHAIGSIGLPGYSDLVVLNTAGQLELVLNNKTGLVAQKVLIASSVEAGSRILLGHVNGLQDRLLDVVLLQPTLGIRVFLGQQQPADTFVEGAGLKAATSVGLLADLTGDSFADLLIATNQTSQGLQLFQGDGRRGFSDVSAKLLPATGLKVASVSSLAVLRSATESLPSVVVGLPGGADLLLRRLGIAFGAPAQLPFRGTTATQQCLVGDLDLDGDDDLVTVRATALPSVLLGQSLQLTQNSLTQVGRSLALSVRLPNPVASALLGIWIQPTRVAYPSLGILRLANPIPVLTFPPSQTTTTVLRATPPGLATVPIPAQLFVIDGPFLRIGNLDILEITR